MDVFGCVLAGHRAVEMSKLPLLYESYVQSSSDVKTRNIEINSVTLPQFDVFGKIKAFFFHIPIYFDKR